MVHKPTVLTFLEDRNDRGIYPNTHDLAARFELSANAAERHLRSLVKRKLIRARRLEALWHDVRFELTDKGRAWLELYRGGQVPRGTIPIV
jgi:DNA-binding MarR family transcriptional regulator